MKRIETHDQAAAGQPAARMTLVPVHVFPVLDANYDLVRTERRTYDAGVTLILDGNGRILRERTS